MLPCLLDVKHLLNNYLHETGTLQDERAQCYHYQHHHHSSESLKHARHTAFINYTECASTAEHGELDSYFTAVAL